MIYTFHIILTPYISSPLPTPVNVWRFESFSHKNLYNITRVNIWKSFRKQSFISGKQWMKAWSRWRWNGFSIFLKTEWVQCSTYVLSVMLYFFFVFVCIIRNKHYRWCQNSKATPAATKEAPQAPQKRRPPVDYWGISDVGTYYHFRVGSIHTRWWYIANIRIY